MANGPTLAEVKAAQDQEFLQGLDPEERDLVQRVMADHPKLTAQEALQQLKLAGM